MQVQGLSETRFGMKIVAGERLGTVDKFDLFRPAHTRHGAKAAQFIFQTVFALNSAEENTVFTLLEVLLRHLFPSGRARILP